MHQPSTFQVYNASAGSGKTFTLVKEYLKIILTSENIFSFQNVLAITFTNKAAAEMKERVLKSLEDFSEERENDLMPEILQETALDKSIIKQRSIKILDAILKNYSAFSITTIDSFTHKIIKSFAYDLGLPLNFEVELDAQTLLNEAVDVLISKIGTDKKLTNLLIEYSLEKADDDKSWDISRDLNEFAKVLLNEDDILHFKKLSNKSLDDFITLKKKVKDQMDVIEKEFASIADKTLQFIKDHNLQFSDFSYSGEYPKHFQKMQKLSTLKFEELKFDGRLNKNIEEGKNLYAAKTPENAKQTIDAIKEQLYQFYFESKEIYNRYYSDYLLCQLLSKSIIPLAVLNKINNELSVIKEENNLQLNAEFNQLISENIKEQPAPFIYERIGQRFQNYFIDEMQDTSVLQWQNLIPLIDNTLAQEKSSLLLVGDAKQAIYRWRGGKAEQFIALGSENNNPFSIKKEKQQLETNYRSYSEIIDFNNKFFKHTSNFLENTVYKKMFIDGNNQSENKKKGGYVSLTFLEDEADKHDKDLRYPKQVLAKVLELRTQFSLGEICVLTRTKKDGIAIANYLSENAIPIVSSETLLLKNSNKVTFLIDVLKLIQNPEDEETKFEILYFLSEHLILNSTKSQFLHQFAKKELFLLFIELQVFGVDFQITKLHQLPFYEKIESIIRSFNLINTSDAYVQFFLDVVLEQQRKGAELNEFLDFWELKKEKLSIVAPESADAVQIMTIHKSKGLEFPVVIFPCDVNIYNQINPKVWLDKLPENFNNFSELYVDFKKSISAVNERGLEIYNQQRQELELDNFNLLYVALTRAVEQLYVITEKKISSKGIVNTNYFSGVFIHYLQENNLWDNQKLNYNFGNKVRVSKKTESKSVSENHEQFISNPWQEHNIVLLASASKLWNTEQGKAIDFGNLIHDIFSKIYTEKDVEKVIQQFYEQGFLDDQQLVYIKNSIENVVHHPELKLYYSDQVTVFNERDIVDIDNQIIIPDRLVFQDSKTVTIIDYKTGSESQKHQQQIKNYARVLEQMNFKVAKKLLIYINDNIDIVEV